LSAAINPAATEIKMDKLTREELLTVGSVLTERAYSLLENHPGDKLFEERAQELLLLANKFNAETNK
jgi:hypothetical protein